MQKHPPCAYLCMTGRTHGASDACYEYFSFIGRNDFLRHDVLVRVSPNYALAMHLDIDEANAAHLATGANGRIDSIQSKSLAGI